MKFVDYGRAISGLDPDQLSHIAARKTLELCLKSGSFDVIELREIDLEKNDRKDIIVVDCINDQVPSRNKQKIKVRERLALVFQTNKIPEVRALRKDFPLVSHLNHVPPNEPVSLCLYFQKWSAVQRSWTPQKHLKRILWWLSETAKDSLHRDDQPLERLYFESPFEIVLPPDYKEKYNEKSLSLICCPIMLSDKKFKVIRVKFVENNSKEISELPNLKILTLNSTAVVHGQISSSPNSLGQLHDQCLERDFDFFKSLRESIKRLSEGGVKKKEGDHCLIIINTPTKRDPESEVEKIFTNAFYTNVDLSILGQATGILRDGMDDSGILYAIDIIGSTEQHKMNWRDLEILPIEVKDDIDRLFAQKLSGIDSVGSNFNGVVIGVGALGSVISDIWAKEAWGNWIFIDHDIIKPHNTIRHVARNSHVGFSKANVVKCIVNENYYPGHYESSAIFDKATNWDNQEIASACEDADLIIDISTTLDVPRDLSIRKTIGRCCSLFLTPSGKSSVLMLEDKDRKIRLDSLEAQYYRSIINCEWGRKHLSGHSGRLWVGAGCRDISAVISFETIQIGAATLARQLRIQQNEPNPTIRIWTLKDNNGSITCETVMPEPAYYTEESGWVVVWDNQVKQKLQFLRNDSLPKETGGIIIGYVDYKIQSIIIVDALPAPYDSDSDLTGFTRGVSGLREALDVAAERTANIVGYIGEWHSHPPFSSPTPSSLDWKLIRTISKIMANEGQPALMLIVGSAGDISLTVKEY